MMPLLWHRLSDSYPISPARYRAKAVKYAIESAGLLGDTEKKSH